MEMWRAWDESTAQARAALIMSDMPPALHLSHAACACNARMRKVICRGIIEEEQDGP